MNDNHTLSLLTFPSLSLGIRTTPSTVINICTLESMGKLRAIVVDDEQKNRDALEKMIFQFCHNVEVVGKEADITSAYNSIIENKPDVVFLDIEMPGGNGFELLEKFDSVDFHVIFTTAHADYAIKALKFAAIDYLLKPVNIGELREAIEKVNSRSLSTDSKEQFNVIKSNISHGKFDFRKITLPSLDGLEFFDVADVVRCEANRAYCKFVINDGREILVSKSLKEFEDILEECNFYRIHKSHMVNLRYIVKYVKGKGGYVVLKDGTHVDVSVRRKESFLKVLNAISN